MRRTIHVFAPCLFFLTTAIVASATVAQTQPQPSPSRPAATPATAQQPDNDRGVGGFLDFLKGLPITEPQLGDGGRGDGHGGGGGGQGGDQGGGSSH